MPATGCVRPQQIWATAKARLTPAKPSPVWVLMVPTNSPIDWRAPIVSAKVPAAATSTQPHAGGAAAGRVSGFIVGLRCGVELAQAGVEQVVQPGDARVPELGVQRQLRLLPCALCLGALGTAG